MVIRVPVGFGLAKAARMEVTAAWPVGFASADATSEVREAACRWDLVHRGAAITRRGCLWAGGIWLQESSENELWSSARWDLGWRRWQGRR